MVQDPSRSFTVIMLLGKVSAHMVYEGSTNRMLSA